MGKYDWYPRDGADFIAGTMGMTLEEKGAYSIVLDLLYSNCKEITDDPRYISGVCGCSIRKWKAIREALISAGKLQSENGKLSNERWRDWMKKNAPKSARNVVETSSKLAPNNLKSHETLSKYPENECETIENKDLFSDAPRAGARATRLYKRREEKKEPQDTLAGVNPPEKLPDKKTGTRWEEKPMPPNFWEYAHNQHGWDDETIAEAYERFSNYWIAKTGRDATKRDWLATWRNWILEDVKRYGKTGKRIANGNSQRTKSGLPTVNDQVAIINRAIDEGKM